MSGKLVKKKCPVCHGKGTILQVERLTCHRCDGSGYLLVKQPKPNQSGLLARNKVFREVSKELAKANKAFPPFFSAHHGYAVLLEEVDELWTEIKKKQGSSSREAAIRAEATQVAAMAIRLILDLNNK